MNFEARLKELSRITGAPTPVVSVYLDTRWADEHQRDRVRLFLKNQLRSARRRPDAAVIAADLDWIEAQAEALITQARAPEADGVALFACQALGLRELWPVRAAFEDTFVVADTPYLRPLAAFLDAAPSTLVVFVDGESARLIPWKPEGAGEEVILESAVPGHHRRGGWALLAQSRYQRHIADHRDRHLEAVAATLLHLAETEGARRIVLAGEPRTVAAFRTHLPERVGARVVGSVAAARHEPASAILARAAELLALADREEEAAAVATVLTEAAKGGRAVAGIPGTLEAATRGAVHRLYLLKGFEELGRACSTCGTLYLASRETCPVCGLTTTPTELGEALVDRVIAAGGTVETVESDPELARVGGVAARLRYPV